MKKIKLVIQLVAILVFLVTNQTSARFLAVDPVRIVDQNGKINEQILANPQRLNLYAYSLNNPYRYIDSDGEFAVIASIAILDAGACALDAMMPRSTNESNSMGALDYMDNATIIAPAGMIKNVNKLPKAVNLLKGMRFSEAKRLISRWSKGNHDNIAESIRYHAKKHGFENNIPKYLRKAGSFNKKGATKKNLSDGATRWNKKNGEFLIEREGKIVSYGKN